MSDGDIAADPVTLTDTELPPDALCARIEHGPPSLDVRAKRLGRTRVGAHAVVPSRICSVFRSE